MLGKKSEAPVGIEPMTFHIPEGRSNHDWVMGNSLGEQVAGVGVATGLHILRGVHWTKVKQHTDLLASCKHLKKVSCTL